MVDFLGTPLSIGDKVVWLDHDRNSSELRLGNIHAFTPTKVRIGYICKYTQKVLTTLKSNDKVVRL